MGNSARRHTLLRDLRLSIPVGRVRSDGLVWTPRSHCILLDADRRFYNVYHGTQSHRSR